MTAIATDADEDLTELEKFAPTRLDGVDTPATGSGFLMLKALGGTEPAPDKTEKAAPPMDAPQDQAPETREAPAPQEAPEPEEETAAKSAAPDPDTVTVDLPRDVSLSISPADLAKLATLRQRLAVDQAATKAQASKRKFDRNTGGGTDRDKIPAEDFAGKNRSFPIVIPKDVHDAAASIGRAGDGNYPPDKLKANIIAIATRKGPKFVDQLPDAWKDDGKASKEAAGEPESAPEATEDAAKGKAFPGAAPPFKAKGDKADDDSDGKDPGDGDGKDDADEDDDGKASKAGSSCGCGSPMAKDAKFCSSCGEPAAKAEKSSACGCGASMEKGAKFCSQCGKAAFGGKRKGKAAKSRAFPADAKVDTAIATLERDADAALAAQAADPDAKTHPADVKVEAALEQVKADVQAAADAQEHDEATDTAAGHATKGAADPGEAPAYHLHRLHDATCAAFRHEDVILAHPAAAKGIGELVDPAAFAKMTTAALEEDGGTGSRAADLPGLSAAYQAAVAVKALAAQPEALTEAMDELRKAFAQYYPDAHPSPGSISPGEFRRPYISAGHANQRAKPGQEPRVPTASHVPEASDFKRPLITAGREAASPGSKPSGVGKAARTYYSNAGRSQAAETLTQMHDWIAGNHPGVCPMAGSAYDGEDAAPGAMGSSLTTAQPVPQQFAGTRNTAVPVAVPAAAQAMATKAERKAAKAARKEAEKMTQAQSQGVPVAGEVVELTQAPLIDPEMLKSVLREVVAEELGDVIKANGDLAQRIADLESAPDPAQMAPRSGAGMAKSQGSGPEVPAGGDGHEAERIARLVKRAKDPDSGVRTAAIGELFGMVPREAAVQLLEAAY